MQVLGNINLIMAKILLLKLNNMSSTFVFRVQIELINDINASMK